MGQQGNRFLLAGMILFVVGVFVGFGGGELFATPPAIEAGTKERLVALPPVAAARHEGADDLAAALVELRMTLDALQATLERTSSTRVPAGTPPTVEDTGDLAASMTALAAAIRSMPKGSGSSARGPGLVIPRWVDRRAAFATEGLRKTYRTDEEGYAVDAAVRAFRSDHLFWSKQDILDRYGKPDDVYRDDGFVEWCYQLHGKGEEEDVDFSFDEGVVVSVSYDYDWDE